MTTSPVKALFVDLGGVLLTNGWGHDSRQMAADHFSLNFDEMNERHRIIFDAYESGKMSLDQYLDLLVFYQERSFSKSDFTAFMMAQSKPYPEMIALVKDLKARYGLKVVTVNNESRELNDFRIQQFGLKDFIDIFASSCYLKARKPDTEIYRLALDISQQKPGEVVYLEDRQVFVETARMLGINAIRHVDIASTKAQLAQYQLI